MNHRGVSLAELVERVRGTGARVELAEPESFEGDFPVNGYDGVIGSGGYLRSTARRDTLEKYSSFFERL